MTRQDRAIVETLTGWPTFVPEWDEYAAVDNNGALHTGESLELCYASVKEANEYIARHERANA